MDLWIWSPASYQLSYGDFVTDECQSKVSNDNLNAAVALLPSLSKLLCSRRQTDGQTRLHSSYVALRRSRRTDGHAVAVKAPTIGALQCRRRTDAPSPSLLLLPSKLLRSGIYSAVDGQMRHRRRCCCCRQSSYDRGFTAPSPSLLLLPSKLLRSVIYSAVADVAVKPPTIGALQRRRQTDAPSSSPSPSKLLGSGLNSAVGGRMDPLCQSDRRMDGRTDRCAVAVTSSHDRDFIRALLELSYQGPVSNGSTQYYEYMTGQE